MPLYFRFIFSAVGAAAHTILVVLQRFRIAVFTMFGKRIYIFPHCGSSHPKVGQHDPIRSNESMKLN
jgi:hypothetical protein